MVLVKLGQDLWQPLGGHAGEGPHPHQGPLAGLGDLVQLQVGGLQALHHLQHLGPHLREGEPPLVPVKDLHPQVVLDVVDDVSQAGLGVAQGLGRPGEAAALGGLDHREVFPHTNPSFVREKRHFEPFIIISEKGRKGKKKVSIPV